MAYVLLLEELLPKNSFLFSIQQEAFFYFYFFNLIFPANMDLQGLPLTAWGWEEASPQATSFWSISFIRILASSSQEECSHCQRHNTRPKRPFKLTKSDSSCIRGYRAYRRGPPDLFSSGQAAALSAVVVGAVERGSRYWLRCGGGESLWIFPFIGHAADRIESGGLPILAEPQAPVADGSIVRTLNIAKILGVQHGQSTFLLQSCTFVEILPCVRTHKWNTKV